MPVPGISTLYQWDAFSNVDPNICEQAVNEPAHCKTIFSVADIQENAASFAEDNRANEFVEAVQLALEFCPDWTAHYPIIAPHFFGLAA